MRVTVIILLLLSTVFPMATQGETRLTQDDIQQLIDALPPQGGAIQIPEGVYQINRSIRLRSGVTLRGSGTRTVLRKIAGKETWLLEPAPKGTSSLLVEHPERFRPGEQIGVVDDKQVGWNATQAIILRIQNGKLELNRGVWADYQPELGGIVVGLFPMLTAGGGENILIEDLTIEADPAEQPSSIRNFTFSALHFNHVDKVIVRRVTIRGYPGDGISIQGGSGSQIVGNVVQECLGHGLHSGGGLENSLFEGNQAVGNGQDGFFFCANVRGVTVRGNLFEANCGHGSGGLGDWGDRENRVEANRCLKNGHAGIVASDGSDNQIVGNVCSGNSRLQPGQSPGILLLNTTDTVVEANRCVEESGEATQSWGVLETGASDGNRIVRNVCRGNRAGSIRTVGLRTIVENNND